ncbi:MAG: GAF domain-containing protein [Cyanobacteria bacterium P01_A01_bin.114]
MTHSSPSTLPACGAVDSRQAELLSGVAEAARRLLSITDIDTAVMGALEAIATAARADRIFIYQNHIDPQTQSAFTTCPYAWAIPGIGRYREIPAQFPRRNGNLNGFSDWVAELKAGRPVQKLTREISAVAVVKSAREQVLSILTLPIFMQGHYWGTLGLDDCTTERIWSAEEIAGLETATACLGSALERSKTLASLVATPKLKTYNQQLRQRDSLLNSVNAAAQCLLANDDLSVALPSMLQILGEGTEQCRAYILKNSQDEKTGELIFNLILEWDAPGILTKREAGGRFPVPVSAFPTRLSEPLRAGQATQFLARELDGITHREAGKALSLVGVPITVNSQWWGVLGLDDCIFERVWSPAEIAVLETAASCIGSAIERDRTRQARELAEREAIMARERAARASELEAANQILSVRERWLEATASAANQLLSATHVDTSVNAALKTIGESLDSDRIGVMRHVPEETGLGRFCLLYEWNSGHAIPQMADPQFNQMPASDFEDWSKQLMAGSWVGGLIAKQEEPFRSNMQKLNTLSAYAVPIFVEATFWGLMFMDYCQDPRRLTPAELSVFRTAATCVGSAIHQELMRSDREQAERSALLGQERNRLAREIHDTLAQSFTGISLQLEAAKGVLNHKPDEAELYINHAGDLARRGLSEARRSVRALRSQALENETLPNALQTAVKEMTQGSSMQAEFLLTGSAYALSEDLRTNLLRISQEAITNALRHAEAKNLRLTLQFSPEQVRLYIIDDGKGCQISAITEVEGFGLLGMRERALRFGGQFYFTSTPGKGTVIDIMIPHTQ